MEQKLHLEIGGVGVAVDWEKGEYDPWDKGFHPKFIVPSPARRPDIQLHVMDPCINNFAPSPSPLPRGERVRERVETLFEAPGNWLLVKQNGSLFFEALSTKNGSPEQKAQLNPSMTEAQVSIRPNRGKFWSLAHLMLPLGKVMLANHLIAQGDAGGLLVHGAGVDDRGSGRIFIGYSGAGKSTISGFWMERKETILLGDERMIIRKKEGRFWLHATPWCGVFAHINAHSVPLKNIYLIHHAPEHRLVKESKSSLLQKIIPQIFLPYWKKEAIDYAFSFLEELLEAVPACSLGFAKSPGVIDFIREGAWN